MVADPSLALRTKVNAFFSTCRTINEIISSKDKRFEDLAKEDLRSFSLLLANAYEPMNKLERLFIVKILNYEIMGDVSIEMSPDPKLFLHTVPETLVTIVNIDNLIKERNLENKISSLSDCFIDICESIGKELLIVDNYIDDIELKYLNDYLTILIQYVDENSNRGTKYSIYDTILYEDIDPDHENVKVFGKKIRVPETIQVMHYKSLMESIAEDYAKLNKCLSDQVKKATEKDDKYGIHMQSMFYDPYNINLNIVTKKILDEVKWIGEKHANYDDIRYYLDYTKGYQSLKKLCNALEAEGKRLYYAKERAIEQGQNLARLNASTQITGMRYGIITNSAPDLLLYHAISKSTVLNQARKADAQYREEASRNARATFNAYTSELNKLFFDIYIPTAKKCIDVWINEITERAVKYESSDNYPLFPEIAKYDRQKSERIVNSIDTTIDKEDIKRELQRAFEACPFDDSIYKLAANLDMLDAETVKAAYSLGVFEIQNIIINLCKSHLKDIDYLKRQLSLLKETSKYSYKDNVHEIFSFTIDSTINHYRELANAVRKENSIVLFLKHLPSSTSYMGFINTDDDTLRKEIRKYIDGIINKDLYNLLIQEGLFSNIDLRQDNNDNLSNINDSYYRELVPVALSFHQKMVYEKDKYDKDVAAYNNKCNEYVESLKMMNSALSQVKLFQFKRKAELKQRIIQTEEEFARYKDESKPQSSWNSWI